MKFMKTFAAVVVTAALALGTVTASQAADKTLTLGAVSKVVSYLPTQAEAGNRAWYYQAVYDQLMLEDETGKIIPNLATAWAYNGTQTRLTLTLRTGVKFSDGTPLDSADVVASLKAFQTGGGPTSNYLDSMSTVKALAPDTVQITLKSADPGFLHYLANTAGTIGSSKSTATVPIGSGPYVLDLDKSEAGAKYVYNANPNYWNKANRAYDSLTILVYENNQTALINALRSGAIQGGNVSDPSAAKNLVGSGFKTVKSYLDAKGIYFSDRGGKHKTCIGDVNVRRAINMVFDRAALNKSLEAGTGVPTAQYFPSASAAFDKKLEALYPFNESKAKALVASSKFPKGCTLKMPTVAGYFGSAAYSIIRAQLGKLNIKVKEVPEGPNFIANILGNKYDAYLMQFERAVEPIVLINFMIGKNATFNTDGFATPTVSKLIADYKAATADKRPAILKALNKSLTEDAWFNVWYALQSNFIHKGINIKSAQTGNVIPFLYNIK